MPLAELSRLFSSVFVANSGVEIPRFEAREPVIDRFPLDVETLDEFRLRHSVLYAMAATSRKAGVFTLAESSAW